jgi:hypothetical protein
MPGNPLDVLKLLEEGEHPFVRNWLEIDADTVVKKQFSCSAIYALERGTPISIPKLKCIDIFLTGGDCAENFDIDISKEIEPGTVMVMKEDGTLTPCCEAYDKKVAGIVSGAGEFKPGIIMGNDDEAINKRTPIALTGKVYCKVDASYSPIVVGDLLTTSPTPGHGMKADDPYRAFGSVIGKAMKPIREGAKMIPVLVGLQ